MPAEFSLVFGSSSTNDQEVAVLTRSLMHQMATMAAQVDVPPEDVSQGRATPGWETMAPVNQCRAPHRDSELKVQASGSLRDSQLSQPLVLD